jgi:hypothetical protein
MSGQWEITGWRDGYSGRGKESTWSNPPASRGAERQDAIQHIEPIQHLLHAYSNWTLEGFEFIVRVYPAEALRYVLEKLTEEQIKNSLTAVRPEILRKLFFELTPDQIASCARAAPVEALKYVSSLHSSDQIKAFIQAIPHADLEQALGNLTPEQIDSCVWAAPLEILMHAPEKLNKRQLDACVRAVPLEAREHVFEKLNPDQPDD